MNSDESRGGAIAPEPQTPAPEPARPEDAARSAERPAQNPYAYAPPPYGYPQAPYQRERPKTRWVPWVIGGVLGVLVIGGVVIALIIALIGTFFASTVNQHEQSTTLTRALTVSGTPSLVISDSVGNITLQTGSGSQVIVQITKHAWGSSAAVAQNGLSTTTVDVLQNGNTITVRSQFNSTYFDGGSARRSVDLLVTVPAQANVDAHLGAGNIIARQMSGTIRLDTGAGNVTLDGVTFSGSSRLNTGAGNIVATCAIASGANVDVHVGAGNATMTLPSSTPAHLDASTGVGAMSITGWQMPMSGSGMTGHHASGDMGANPTGKLTIQVGTGNVTLMSR